MPRLVSLLEVKIAHKVINLSSYISGTDKRVGGAILDHFNCWTAQCDPSVDRLAKLLHLDRRSIIRSVQRLDRTGLIRRQRHGGHSHRNSYQPDWSLFLALEIEWKESFSSKSSPLRCQNASAAGDKGATQTLIVNSFKGRRAASALHRAVESLQESKLPINQKRKSSPSSSTRSFTSGTPTISADVAARSAAERRWSMALHKRFASSVARYGEIIDVTPEMQTAATDAELRQPGTGLRYVLEQLRIEP